MGFVDKMKDFIAPVDEEEGNGELELTREEAETLSTYEQPLTSGNAINSNASIVLFEPRTFEEAEEIGRHIRKQRACCINLHRMPSEYRQRVIDFLSGVVFGLGGTIKKIGENVILCSPRSLQVGGDIDLNTRD